MTSQHLIDELRDIIEKEFSIELGKDEAAQVASDLVRLFELLAKQDRENNHKNYGKI